MLLTAILLNREDDWKATAVKSVIYFHKHQGAAK